MSYTVTDPALLPPATAPPPYLAWIQANPILVMGATFFLILEQSKKPYRRKRRRKKK